MSDKTKDRLSPCCGEKMENVEPSVYQCSCGKEWQRKMGQGKDDWYWDSFYA